MNDGAGRLKAALQSASPLQPNLDLLQAGPTFESAVERLVLSRADTGHLGADQAVLLRQAIRWSGAESRSYMGRMSESANSLRPFLEKAGLEWSSDGYLTAEPFSPRWSGDTSGCDKAPELRMLDESLQGESFLHSIGYDRWRSPAQKEAAWSTLVAPPGRTRLIVLPTGAGKSLCYQLLPRFTPGLTLVVVPTIALALDQQSIATDLLARLPNASPCCFSADDYSESVLQQIRDRRTRLIFTSPEACVSGRLRPILDEFARSGWLQTLVVDEAHLVETWGADFRVEFQVLAAVRRKWLELTTGTLRTFLFSATMTAKCRSLLRELFSQDGKGDEFVCQRLRPEIQYYGEVFRDSRLRENAVLESFWHLPRPAILYVTEKKEAEHFLRLATQEGFRRVGCFHGETPRTNRRELLRRWKTNDIDLMVATSAFGVGVDKPDVRTVIHACYPENLDRYYQEVGRAGRDGWSCVSFFLPTQHDREVASGLSVKLMTPELIQERWEAMFRQSRDLGNYAYSLPLNVRRTGLVGTRTYNENAKWNKRLLLQLQRAGRLALRGLQLEAPEEQGDDREEWAEVQVTFAPNTPKLGELIRQQREEELEAFGNGLEQLDAFLSADICRARVLAHLYGIDASQRICGGCRWCRSQDREPLACPPLGFPVSVPMASGTDSHMIDSCPSPLGRGGRTAFIELIYQCVTHKNLRRFLCPDAAFTEVLSCFSEAFPSNVQALYRVDPLSSHTEIGLFADEAIVFLHIGDIEPSALKLARGRRAMHFLCAVKDQFDRNGRHVSVNEGSRLWPSTESWLLELQSNQV